MTNFAPAFILVRPQLGENIGAAARVMKNFGFTDLRIVNPRDGWPNAAAESMAAGGLDVLQGATLYDSTREAVADLQSVYATTARPRDMEKPAISLHSITQTLQEKTFCQEPAKAVDPFDRSATERQTVGILFGPERTGLENEDIAQADCITYVPVNADYPSLNLAQTVALMAYECSKCVADAAVRKRNSAQPAHYSQGHHPERAAALAQRASEPKQATKQELNGFFDQLETELDARNFWKVVDKKEKMWVNIRNLFTRAELTDQEVRTLRGMIRSLSER